MIEPKPKNEIPAVEDSKSMTVWTVFLKLARYVAENRGVFSIAIVAMLVYSAVTSTFPWALKEIIDSLSRQTETIPLIRYFYIAGGLLLLFIIRGISYYWQNFIMLSLGQKLNRDLRDDLFQKLINLPFSYFNRQKTGDLLSRFTTDISYIEQAFVLAITGPVRDLTNVIFLLGYLSIINVKLFFVSFTLLIPAIYLINLFGRLNRKVADVKQTSLGNLNAILNETLFGIRIVKAFNMELYEIRRFFSANSNVLKHFVKTARIAALSSPLLDFVAAVYMIIIFGFGSYLINQNELTYGQFFSFFMAFYMIVGPIRSFNGFNLKMQEAAASAKRIFDVIESTEDNISDKLKPDLPKIKKGIDIKINNFSFGSKTILKDIDIHIASGEVVAFVGQSGGGKTTLANLLPRFYELKPEQGTICFDGNDIAHHNLSSLRQQISMVTQETVLFNDTIKYNVAYGKRTKPLAEIVRVCKLANAHEFISNLEQGYGQMVGEKGLSLSGGQRQRLAIARAILKDAPILILDEATNALDAQSESEVNQALTNLMQGRTAIIIAHKLSTIKDVSRIFVMKDGSIIEQGTYTELMSKGGEFSQLYRMSQDEYIL